MSDQPKIETTAEPEPAEKPYDIALTCSCGSVKWCLLGSGHIECASCLTPNLALHWERHFFSE